MIRLASIGTSSIASKFIAASGKVPGAEFAIVYSRDADRAREFAAANGLAGHSSDFEVLLASDDVDALYIASPNSVHYEQCLAAIRAGKHVLVEKPATTDAASFARLRDAAADAGVVLLEAMRNAYDPGMATIRELLPQLGAIRRASFDYCQRSARYDLVLAGQRVNIFDPAMGGGALLDLGVYCISAAVDLFGAPTAVVGQSVPLPTGADGAGAALLGYEDLVVDVSYSKISFSRRPSEIQGELGTLLIDHIDAPRKLRLVSSTESDITVDEPVDNLHCSLERFVELVDGDRDANPDQTRTLYTLRIADEIRRQAAG